MLTSIGMQTIGELLGCETSQALSVDIACLTRRTGRDHDRMAIDSAADKRVLACRMAGWVLLI